MPRWFIFIIIAGAAWQVISAIIQQSAKKREAEKLQEAARLAGQARSTGRQQGTPQPTRMGRPSPIGKTHAETLAERRRAQLEELRARRRAKGTTSGSPPTQVRTPTARSSGPQPIPLPTPAQRRAGPQAVSLTSRPTGASSKPGKAIHSLKPNLRDAQASLITHSDVERKARDIQKQRDRQQAEIQQQARERVERELVEKARNRTARKKAQDKAREREHDAEHEGQSVAHRLVRGPVGVVDPYGLHQVVHGAALRAMLASPRAARQAIALTEILGPPVSMR